MEAGSTRYEVHRAPPNPPKTLADLRVRRSNGKPPPLLHWRFLRCSRLPPAVAATVLDTVGPASTSLLHSSPPLSGSPSTNPRWPPARAPMVVQKVSLPLSVLLCSLRSRSRNILCLNKEKRKRSILIVHCVDSKVNIGISRLHSCRSRLVKLDSSVNRKKSMEKKEYDANRKEQKESMANRVQQ